MISESAFLEAIGSEPKGSPRRLIYADWLEEQGDPRAELIRLEEEMRTLAVYSDRYWELKPRRNELRKEAESKWLEVMRYGTDYEPVFAHGWPDGWKERWRIVRRWVEIWEGVSLPDVGGHQDVMNATERELGLTLPPSIREWISFSRDLDETEHCEHLIRDPLGLQLLPEHSSLSLLMQAEGDSYWAVSCDHLTILDPPVDHYSLSYVDENGNYVFAPDEHNPITNSVAWLVFKYVEAYGTFPDWSIELGEDVFLDDWERIRDSLCQEFTHTCEIDDDVFFEREDMVIGINRRTIWALPGTIQVYDPKVDELDHEHLPEVIQQYL
ncbi:MAG: TIGR02996 domain-containing protein [Gemmataceae bacterium]